MYRVSVQRDLIAQHYLTVPNPGPEGELHSHAFTVEVELSGPELNEYGYLVDIDDVKAALDATLSRYRDETMNDLVEFSGQNPSVERFAREVCTQFIEAASLETPERVSVRIWEDDVASATYETSI
ncbi:6-carboxytetrahydropterin synthase [Haloferax mediterranei ATCC 33500]|uniref:6-carboxytetrahydropterin synthase n=1 Tax=Haloferax mediterranei (strain ATCC 33500 / DSM 1411 / JCM 8866 / NBRC 14739 / NCIMB 2177 / R-4) TaxID=523841 RepID=I3R499_HALMT|nr:6-carboxytetrahydropterin synthase [Haloferax mediterranei]AFK19059.1 6-pyruvoyltetrahydropterin synthase [Haloferax mediterranei ATCC 33500]AHZ21582.1 6-pyruvoyl tetrahydropterin synthase [Haloferax mediterranei ATCC 33500]EMA04046.1 6-pyruvoyl-tetrahydropterin synthase [Haloferax mediterranei ATCC 33500]MDX5989149.1 6-carboxytetrahydropterin synthase [Haloferax mediterranei ATCC 33500]QCQ75532.1 6-carboxytetrahydropterin synthase [Haloferax mediterranei ATCC 33500]